MAYCLQHWQLWQPAALAARIIGVMQHAALATKAELAVLAALAERNIGIKQRAALAACIMFKYFHATEQHYAFCKKWRRTVRSTKPLEHKLFSSHNFFITLVSSYVS